MLNSQQPLPADVWMHEINPYIYGEAGYTARLAIASRSLWQDYKTNLRCLRFTEPGPASRFSDAHVAFLPRQLDRLDAMYPTGMTDIGVASLPPNLHALVLLGDYALTDICVPHLPRSLRVLELPDNDNLTDQCVSQLPRTLVVLNLRSAPLTVLCTDELPPLLEHAILRIPLGTDGVPCLPRALRTFLSSGTSDLTDVQIRALPEQLRRLDLQQVHDTHVCGASFPRSLEILRIKFRHWPADTEDSFVIGLPRGLRELCLPGVCLSESGISALPEALEELDLRFRHREFCADALVRRMPRTIKRLTLGWVHLTDECATGLPPSLEELTVAATSHLSRFTDTFAQRLPTTLRKLSLDRSAFAQARFPSGLQVLILDEDTNLRDDFIGLLPRGLRVLQLDAHRITWACLPDLPRSLHHLNLRCSALPDPSIRHLPRGLATLILQSDACGLLTDACVPGLPRTLRTLEINGTRNLTPACVPYLPTTLTYLLFDGRKVRCGPNETMTVPALFPDWDPSKPLSVEELRACRLLRFDTER